MTKNKLCKFRWPNEETIYRGLIALCMINEHKSKCSRHEVYWSKQITESAHTLNDIKDYCLPTIGEYYK